MAPEHAPGFRTPRPNTTVLVAAWILGLAAVLELGFAAVALLPSLVAAIHSKGTPRIPSPALQASQAIDLQTTETAPTPIPVPQANPLESSPVRDMVATGSQSLNQAATIEKGTSKEPANGTPLGIVSARLVGGNDGSKKLLIAIKARSGETIEVPQVKVQVYFYDQDGEGGDVLPSKAQVTSSWMSLPISWRKKGEPELLQVSYLPDQTDQALKFAGYVVAIYYKGDLQDYRSEPSSLQKQFPLKYFIGLDE